MNIIKKFIELKNDFKLFIIEGFLIILVSIYINFVKGEEDFRIIFIFLLFSFYVFLISLKYIIKYLYLFFLKFKKQVIFMFKLALLITCFYLIYKAKFLIEDINMYESLCLNKNNNEIIIEDKPIVNNELDANGKDIIIILDFFNFDTAHGNEVSDRLKGYFEKYLKKEIDIKIINLSFNKKNNDINHLDLIRYKNQQWNRYKIINKELYSLETYIKRIKEINPNSKIVLSLSFQRDFFTNDVIALSKKYDFKIAQAYFNNGFFEHSYENGDEKIGKTFFNVIFWFNFVMDKTNTIVISRLDDKPFFWIYSISYNNIQLNNKIDINDMKRYLKVSSYLTPVLGYEYYLNKNSNYIENDKDYLFFD